MEALVLQGSEFTPTVNLDAIGLKFEITGESRPENAGKFYEPIIKWLEQYRSFLQWQKGKSQAPSQIKFSFRFDYFNSTSAKYVLDIFKQLDSIFADGNNLVIVWSFDSLDEDMRDSGEEFAKLIKVPFEFKPIES